MATKSPRSITSEASDTAATVDSPVRYCLPRRKACTTGSAMSESHPQPEGTACLVGCGDPDDDLLPLDQRSRQQLRPGAVALPDADGNRRRAGAIAENPDGCGAASRRGRACRLGPEPQRLVRNLDGL